MCEFLLDRFLHIMYLHMQHKHRMCIHAHTHTHIHTHTSIYTCSTSIAYAYIHICMYTYKYSSINSTRINSLHDYHIESHMQHTHKQSSRLSYRMKDINHMQMHVYHRCTHIPLPSPLPHFWIECSAVVPAHM